MNKLWQGLTNLMSKCVLTGNSMNSFNSISSPFWIPQRNLPTLLRMHQRTLEWQKNPKIKKKKSPLDGKPVAKGIVLKNVVKKPRKPNSANRKCVLVRLSTGKEMVAYVPGIGHNLQEHQTVLCRVGRLKDTPGVKIKCIRGKYDLPLVKPKK